MPSREKPGVKMPEKDVKKSETTRAKRKEQVDPSADNNHINKSTSMPLSGSWFDTKSTPWVRIFFVVLFTLAISLSWYYLGWLVMISAFVQLTLMVFMPLQVERVTLILRPILHFLTELIQYIWCMQDTLPHAISGLEAWIEKVMNHSSKDSN